MCGIIGYKGFRNAGDILVKGLKKLEYRGYDSWGIAIKNKERLSFIKKIGKIKDFNEELEFSGNLGIGHTRWATTGKVSETNAHPHFSCDKKIALVHNGIIENYQELKRKLMDKGHEFYSETDTEVIAHLIEDNIDSGLLLEDSVKKAAEELKGRSAFVVISKDNDKIIAIRNGSPLIIGVGDNEYFIASDIPAFLEYTNKVMYLDDNEMAIINNKIEFYSLIQNKKVKKRLIEIDWDTKQAERGSYPHFMIKEIMEQKETIRNAINQNDKDLLKIADSIKNAFGTFIIGCGTAGKVALTAQYLFSIIANKHINSIFASEFPNYHHFLTDKTLVIAISQSGETADVLEAIKTAREKQAKIISILNVYGSSMMRQSHESIMINAGPEKAVASTKATTAQLALVTLLAYACANKLEEGKRLLIETASQVNDMLNPRYEDYIKTLAEKICNQENIYIIGRSLNYPMALEAAIKIQEVSYIHAEGFAGGELKHGPLALIGKNTPCIALVANDETKDEILVNANEVKVRGGFIIGISPENNSIFDYWIKVPDINNASPIVNIIPIQILAYHLALLRGCDPDYPRSLAKSVTVK